MLEDFKHYIDTHFSFLFKTKILVTVSGGLDSMVLLYLCKKLTLDIAVAHCNFQLRGKESDGDTAFVKVYCEQHQIPFFKKNFDTQAFAKTSKTSTQIAARTLRYEWFEQLSVAEGFDYILTAHHLNDDLETFLINLGRGTGINGLTGIPSINNKVVRPLLGFSRKRIHSFAIENKLQWREDSSNATDHYQRNHLRHHAIPALEEAQPTIFKGFVKTQNHLLQSNALLKVYEAQLRQQLLTSSNGIVVLNINDLLEHQTPDAVLYALFSPYGFTAWEDIYKLPKAQSGKQVFSTSHKLLKNREEIQLVKLDDSEKSDYVWKQNIASLEGPFGKLVKETVNTIKDSSNNVIYVDADLIVSPLILRTWKEGDYFYPYGLGGKKKLSKFYKDEKLSLIDKDKTLLLCQDDKIIWIVGKRADNRFRVKDNTQEILKISFYDA